MQLPTTIPKNESGCAIFEDHMNVDGEEEISYKNQLKHFLVYFVVLFQAKHLSVQAGEDLLAFFSFFVGVLGHGMEVPTEISIARVMVNHSSASSGVSRFLVCFPCRSVYTTGILHTRQCSYVRFANNPHRQEQPCGNPLFVGSTVKPALEYPYNSILEILKKFFARPAFKFQIEQWRSRSVEEDILYDIYDGRVWGQLADSNAQPFVNKERSLMVSLNVDWFQPSDGMHYSCGGVYLTINNLPRSSRMKTSNIILVGIIPIPGDQLQSFLRPMIAELNTLYGGIMMPTYQNRNGEIVCVALMSVNCDIPATLLVQIQRSQIFQTLTMSIGFCETIPSSAKKHMLGSMPLTLHNKEPCRRTQEVNGVNFTD
ncbi:hypothetical protein G6F60_012214 [Rhizopus arrhizus]|nr:hypothetical protein G6F60_012214 [Rhizopus arrhizus]